MELHEYLEQVRRAVQQLERSGVIFEQMRLLQRKLNEIALPVRNMAAAIDRFGSAYRVFLQGLRFPDFEAWRKAEAEASAILVERGWWPHPQWPAGTVHEVIRLKRQGKIRQLDRLICESYEFNRAQPMRRAIRRWMNLPEFHGRRRLFEDGLWVYRKKKYGLAVTHWLPHIEGVLRELAERQGLAQGGWKQAARGVAGAQPDHASSFAKAFLEALTSLYDNTLPVGRRPATKSRFPVQRHAILHGVDLRFNRRAYAMRVFLMLDTLHYFISDLEHREATAA